MAIPRNNANTKVKKGIENLFAETVFIEQDYKMIESVDDYGAKKKNEEFQKMKFCDRVCEEVRTPNDSKLLFSGFEGVVKQIESWVTSWQVATS